MRRVSRDKFPSGLHFKVRVEMDHGWYGDYHEGKTARGLKRKKHGVGSKILVQRRDRSTKTSGFRFS